MTRLTHPQLVKALGFSEALDEDPMWYPAEKDVQRLFYVALRHRGLEGADALQILLPSPIRVRQILALLDDTDIEQSYAMACAIQPMTADLAEASDIIKAWCARQTVYKTLLNRQKMEK